jgi:hypothetical protein
MGRERAVILRGERGDTIAALLLLSDTERWITGKVRYSMKSKNKLAPCLLVG